MVKRLIDIIFWVGIIILAVWIILKRNDLILIGIALVLILIYLNQKLNNIEHKLRK